MEINLLLQITLLKKKEYFKDDNGFVTLRSKCFRFYSYSFVRWENKFFLEISGEKGSIIVTHYPMGQTSSNSFQKGLFRQKMDFYKDNSWLNEWNYFKRKIETKI